MGINITGAKIGQINIVSGNSTVNIINRGGRTTLVTGNKKQEIGSADTHGTNITDSEIGQVNIYDGRPGTQKEGGNK